MRKNAVIEYMEELTNDGWYVIQCNVDAGSLVQFRMVCDDCPEYTLRITGCAKRGTRVTLWHNHHIVAGSEI